jgi:hypothetical protein
LGRDQEDAKTQGPGIKNRNLGHSPRYFDL